MITKAMASLGLAAGVLLMGTPAVLAQKPPNPQTGQVRVAPADAEFMVQAAQSDLTEIRTSQLALDKSQNSQVRSYAQRMIDQHTKSSNELKQLAEQKNVTLPAKLNPTQQALYDKLSKLSGEQFDRAYLEGQEQAHDKTASVYQQYLSRGQDDQAVAFARKYLPVVQNHEKLAADLSEGRVAGSSGGMDQMDQGGTMTQPGGTTSRPGGTTTEPGGTTSRPGGTTPGSTTEPGSTTTEPGITRPGSGSTTTEPGTTSRPPQ